MKLCYRHRGTISVFLTLILLPMLVFGGLVTDAVRIYHSEGLVSEAGELAMNAGLSHYDTELKDDYGLFVMEKTPQEMSSDLEKYFINTIRASGLDGAENVSTLLDLKSDSFGAYGVEGSEIYQTEVEKQQILEYMKYRAPVCLGEELFDKLTQIKETKKQTEAVEAQVEYAESMDELQECCEKVYEELKKYINQAENSIPITVTGINGTMDSAENLLKEAAAYCFLIDVIDKYSTKGRYAEEGDVMGFIRDYNTQTESLAGCTEGNAFSAEYIQQCMSALYDRASVVHLGGVPSSSDLKTKEEKEACTTYNSRQSVLNDYRGKLVNQAKSKIQSAWGLISEYYVRVMKALDYMKDAKTQMEKLKKKLKEAQNSHSKWEKKVGALSDDSDMKKTMQESLNDDAYKDLLDAGKIDEFLGKLDTNIENLNKMKSCLEKMKFCNLSITTSDGFSAYHTIQSKVTACSFFPDSNDDVITSVKNRAASFMTTDFTKEYVPDGCQLFTIKTDAIYKNLEKICQKSEETSESTEYKNKTDGLMKDANDDDTSGSDFTFKEVNWSSVKLPSEVLSMADGDTSDNYRMDEDSGSKSKAKRKKAMSSAKSTLSSASDLLGSLSEILEDGLEHIYIMEYGMQMFSYYTVDKDDDGKTLTSVRSISNDDLTDNAMYKAEVEYMLWGQKDVEQNVQNTKLLLYGIRALFNMIYAFSDKNLSPIVTGMATLMSCGQAYLVPVFEVVIKVAVAGAETFYDVKTLMQGKTVPVFKEYREAWIALPGCHTNSHTNYKNFTMNYREYLTLFLLIHTFGPGEAKTLARIADCVQLNTKLDITEKCYTMLSIESEVESRTSFMSKAASLPDGGSGKSFHDWYTIQYQSVLGY